jgi:hypothetical protein
MVKRLLEDGADPNKYDELGCGTPLIASDAADTVTLLTHGASISKANQSRLPPLFTNDIVKAAILLRSGAPINAINGNGMTALIYACYMGNNAVARFLIAKSTRKRALIPRESAHSFHLKERMRSTRKCSAIPLEKAHPF